MIIANKREEIFKLFLCLSLAATPPIIYRQHFRQATLLVITHNAIVQKTLLMIRYVTKQQINLIPAQGKELKTKKVVSIQTIR
jgi:hypothetical protein